MEAAIDSSTTILTLDLAEPDHLYFERLRQQHYPAALNRIPAHISLFHTLPPLAEVRDVLAFAADREPFAMRVTGLRSLGRGVAFTLASQDSVTLHTALASVFGPRLTSQDRQPFKPHVVVQNKTTPEEAKRLKALLEQDFKPFAVQAVGLTLWNYLGGPWQHAASFPFR